MSTNRPPQLTIGFLMLVTVVFAFAAACAAYLVRAAGGEWREMIWFSPITSAAPLILLTLVAVIYHTIHWFRK